jgi:hypothetical protein
MTEQTPVPEWAKGLTPQPDAPQDAPFDDRYEYAAIAAAAVAAYPVHSELSCILAILEPPIWMAGLWSKSESGWKNSRPGGADLSFDDARALIESRIAELGLDANLVYAFPNQRGVFKSWQAEHAWHQLPFSKRMDRFRLQEAR